MTFQPLWWWPHLGGLRDFSAVVMVTSLGRVTRLFNCCDGDLTWEGYTTFQPLWWWLIPYVNIEIRGKSTVQIWREFLVKWNYYYSKWMDQENNFGHTHHLQWHHLYPALCMSCSDQLQARRRRRRCFNISRGLQCTRPSGKIIHTYQIKEQKCRMELESPLKSIPNSRYKSLKAKRDVKH